MKEYIKGAEVILKNGFYKGQAREGMPSTKGLFNLNLKFKLNPKVSEMPILTTKEVNFKNVVVELLWLLKGYNNIKYLVDNDCNIWNKNAHDWFVKLNRSEDLGFPEWGIKGFVEQIKGLTTEELVADYTVERKNGERYTLGDNGRIYGWQWRNRRVDQIQRAIDLLINQPLSRHNKTVAWVTDDMNYDLVSQPNCHGDFTISGRELDTSDRIEMLKRRLKGSNVKVNLKEIGDLLKTYRIPTHSFSLSLDQRSGDYALGIPYNITSYSLMMYCFGIFTNTIPAFFNHKITDAHIYKDHLSSMQNQVRRVPMNLPVFTIKDKTFNEWLEDGRYYNNLQKFLEEIEPDDFQLHGYRHHGAIKFKLHTGKH